MKTVMGQDCHVLKHEKPFSRMDSAESVTGYGFRKKQSTIITTVSLEKIIKMKLSYSSAVEQKETFHLTKRFDKVQRSKNNFFK
jgi:hypothetical protein